jgi:hypothetical protein
MPSCVVGYEPAALSLEERRELERVITLPMAFPDLDVNAIAKQYRLSRPPKPRRRASTIRSTALSLLLGLAAFSPAHVCHHAHRIWRTSFFPARLSADDQALSFLSSLCAVT